MGGAGEVLVDGQKIDKAGTTVKAEAEIRLLGHDIPYVSRGGLKLEKAMKEFDYASKGYGLDLTPERVFYFYHDCSRFFKYVRPVKHVDK